MECENFVLFSVHTSVYQNLLGYFKCKFWAHTTSRGERFKNIKTKGDVKKILKSEVHSSNKCKKRNDIYLIRIRIRRCLSKTKILYTEILMGNSNVLS